MPTVRHQGAFLVNFFQCFVFFVLRKCLCAARDGKNECMTCLQMYRKTAEAAASKTLCKWQPITVYPSQELGWA